MTLRLPTRAELVQWVRSVRAADTHLPSHLVLSLGAGCLVLFGFFAISPSQYRNLPPLLADRQPKGQTPAQAARAESRRSRELAVRALGLEENGRVAELDDQSRIEISQERVAANILLRSGFLHSACAETSDGNPPETHYHVVLDGTASQCARLDFGEDAAPDPGEDARPDSGEETAIEPGGEATDRSAIEFGSKARDLALAAVAVEKFHRNALHRRLEWAYVRTYSFLFGRLPDISLGPAQIRVGSVRRIAAEIGDARGPYAILRGSDKELTEALLDECKSLNLAATMMFHYLSKAAKEESCVPDERHGCPSTEEIAAANYAGHRRKTHAVIDYAPVVVSMVTMLEGGQSCGPGG